MMDWFEVIAKRISIPSMAYTDYIIQQHVREPQNLNQILDLMFDDSKIEEYENNYSNIKPSKELEYKVKNQSDRMSRDSWVDFRMPTGVQKKYFPSRKELERYLKKNYSSGQVTGETKYWSD